MKPIQLLTVAQWCALPAKQAADGNEDRFNYARDISAKLARIGKTAQIKTLLNDLGYFKVSEMYSEPVDLIKYVKLIRPLYFQHYPPAPKTVVRECRYGGIRSNDYI